ncbi:MAG: S8 family serine peptidase [Ilumatobacteraceae bacterium]
MMNRRRPHLLPAFALVVGVGHVTFPVAASADGPAAVADPVVELVDGSYVPGEVIVRYDDVLDRRELRAITGALDATLPDVTSVPIGPAGSPTRLLTFDDDTPVSSVIESLAGTPGITHVEPNQYRELRRTPTDPQGPSRETRRGARPGSAPFTSQSEQSGMGRSRPSAQKPMSASSAPKTTKRPGTDW